MQLGSKRSVAVANMRSLAGAVMANSWQTRAMTRAKDSRFRRSEPYCQESGGQALNLGRGDRYALRTRRDCENPRGPAAQVVRQRGARAGQRGQQQTTGTTDPRTYDRLFRGMRNRYRRDGQGSRAALAD